ncbi:MAG: hypothetical protein II700_06220 [Firmicutes bacterium]|nr:hypothetical protein [Bacillota bacterium]
MRDMILQALRELDIPVYDITLEKERSAELFFIRKTLDMRRIKDVARCAVTVYRDFEADGRKYRGRSVTQIFEGMSLDEVKARLKSALFAAQFVKNPFYELYEGKKEEPVAMPSTLADRSLEDDAMLMAQALFAADTEEDAWINSAEVFAIEKQVTFLNSSGTDVSYSRYLVEGEFVTQCKTPQDVEQFFQFAYADLNTEALTEKARKAIAAVRDRAAAQESPQAGTYDVVLSGDQVGTLMNYYLDRANAALVYAQYSDWAAGKRVQGEEVKGEKLNLKLLPQAPYSPEGIPMAARPLVENGELRTLYGALRFCQYLGLEPTGNYERFGLDNGTVALKDLQKGCLCPVSFSDFQMDAFTGHFGGEIRLAYLYTDEGVKILTGGSINGNLSEKQGNLLFSKERYDTMDYTGPFAVRIEGVEVAG